MSEWCSVCRTRVDDADMEEGRRGEKLGCPDCGTALKSAKKTRRSPRARRE